MCNKKSGDPAISIHAAREGGDDRQKFFGYYKVEFQSTPPVKAATMQTCRCHPTNAISIHAAREGGDNRWYEKITDTCQFQSTPPVKAATDCRTH